MLGWGSDAYTEAVIAKELQVIFKATVGRPRGDIGWRRRRASSR